MWPQLMILLVTLLLPISAVFFSDFSRRRHIFTGHRRNPWLALMELLGSVGPRLKTAALMAHSSCETIIFVTKISLPNSNPHPNLAPKQHAIVEH